MLLPDSVSVSVNRVPPVFVYISDILFLLNHIPNTMLTLVGFAFGSVLSVIPTMWPSLVMLATNENENSPVANEVPLRELRGIRP